MSDPNLPVTPIENINAPWNKVIEIGEVAYEGGMKLLRLRIREGNRFTDLELDPDTAARWGKVMADWAEKQT